MYVTCVRLRIFVVVSSSYCVVFCFLCLRLVYPMLSVFLDFLFLIAPSVFSNVYWCMTLVCCVCLKFVLDMFYFYTKLYIFVFLS